jgi:hypothetical protein
VPADKELMATTTTLATTDYPSPSTQAEIENKTNKTNETIITEKGTMS